VPKKCDEFFYLLLLFRINYSATAYLQLLLQLVREKGKYFKIIATTKI
jgi:hypothetical protein